VAREIPDTHGLTRPMESGGVSRFAIAAAICLSALVFFAGYSIMRKICQRVAENDRARLTMSGSTVRMAVSTFTITGKNTIRIATRILG